MTCHNFSVGYAGYRGYTYVVHLCVVREGVLSPSQYPMSTFTKTSEKYVTYVTHVTDLNFLDLVFDWASGPDLLSNEYGFRYPWAVGSGPQEPRWNGMEHPSNILAMIIAIFLVIIVSPRRNIRTKLNNYVEIPFVIFWKRIQLCKGETQ